MRIGERDPWIRTTFPALVYESSACAIASGLESAFSVLGDFPVWSRRSH